MIIVLFFLICLNVSTLLFKRKWINNWSTWFLVNGLFIVGGYIGLML